MNAWAESLSGLGVAAISFAIILVSVWVAVLVAPKDQR